MPIAPVGPAALTTPGQILFTVLNQVGVGQPPDETAIISLTGNFTAATFGIEGVPLGQPLGTIPIPIAEAGVINGQTVSSPVGPLSSSGVAGNNGFAFAVPLGAYSALQVRLISIGGGSVLAGIATVPFPVTVGQPSGGNPVNTLELSRIRVGNSILLEGLGINLQDLSASDLQGFE